MVQNIHVSLHQLFTTKISFNFFIQCYPGNKGFTPTKNYVSLQGGNDRCEEKDNCDNLPQPTLQRIRSCLWKITFVG